MRETKLIHPGDKILSSLEHARTISEKLKQYEKRIVVTSGAFDLIHDGHVKYVWEARQHGDILIVGIDSDYLVKKIKGDDRPVNSQDVRVYVMASLSCVDYTLIHDSSLDLVKSIRPDYFVASLSTEISGEGRMDCRWVEKSGGRVITFDPMSENHSTQMIAKINGRNHS